jgi:hypothetical protein
MLRIHPHVYRALAAEDPRFTDPSIPSGSCCCPAPPVVKAIIPPAAGRTDPVDLWLCGHHLQTSLQALRAAGASVEDLTVTRRTPHGPAAPPAQYVPPPPTVPRPREQSDDTASGGDALPG